MRPENLPWTVPIPVKKSSFTSLHAKDSKFNIEVDLSELGAFSHLPNRTYGPQVVFSDLQTNADINSSKRLGSGRSAFYDNKYIKGIGRTLLAGNWNDPVDIYHNSGALLTTAAIREYLISQYMAGEQKSHLITVCDGMLLKPLPAEFKGHQENIFRRINDKNIFTSSLPRANTKLQAITVKDANFFRLSNFVWWLDNFPQFSKKETSIVSIFFRLFHLGCDSEADSQLKLTPQKIVKAFSRSIERSCKNFLEAWELGIGWGSLHNNFTMDGRYLDLETPVIMPSATFGIPKNIESEDAKSEKIISNEFDAFLGFEIIYYLRQVKVFISFLDYRLRFLVKNNLVRKIEAIFIKEFLQELRESFDKNHPINSNDALIDLVVTFISRALKLNHGEKKLLESWFSLAILSRLKNKDVSRKSIPLYKLNYGPYCRPEPNLEGVVFVPSFIYERGIKVNSRNDELSHGLIRADEIEDLDNLMQCVLGLGRKLRARKL